MRFEDFQDGNLGGHLTYQNRMILAILNLYVAPMPPIVWVQSTFIVVWKSRLKNFNMVTVAAILEDGTEWIRQFWLSMFL